MTRVDPLIEQLGLCIGQIAGTDAHDSLIARDALDGGPDFRESSDHDVRWPRLSVNVATSGRQRMRTGGIAPMPRLTYINTRPTR